MPTMRSIPRTALTTYLRALRIPLSAAERISGQRGNDRWPPTLAFEQLEAKVETAVGVLLRDDELTTVGEQRTAKVLKLKEAEALENAAEYEKTKARETERKRKAQAARDRARANRAARARKDKIQAQAAAEKQAAAENAAKQAMASEEQEAAQQKVIDRRERAARAEALRAESDAIDLTDEALQAKDKLDLIDETLAANKEARQTG
jgi:hypothetical protein